MHDDDVVSSVPMNNGRNRKDNILAATGDVSDKSFSKSFVGINKFEGA
jgi:hypothetical protein